MDGCGNRAGGEYVKGLMQYRDGAGKQIMDRTDDFQVWEGLNLLCRIVGQLLILDKNGVAKFMAVP